MHGLKISVAKSMQRLQQTERILSAIARKDLTELKRLARLPYGFVNDTLRKLVWPILLHTQHGNYIAEKGSEKDLADPVQITKDVERSLYYYPQDVTPVFKAHKQQELHCMIVEILWRNPSLKYYQGFHDICTCFLLVLGKKAAIPAAENVALFFIRDAMLDSFEPVSKQLRLMSSLIEYEDPSLTLYMEKANVMPYYALSWILTWFSHDFEDYDKVIRLFDLFISSQAFMPVFIASAIILLRRHEILMAEKDSVHSLVTRIPQDIDIEHIIEKAVQLESKHTVLQLQKQSGIWLHEESAINTWETDWGHLTWHQVPDQLQANRHLAHGSHKEEWEDEMLTQWTMHRRQSIVEDEFDF
ncbi:rab-GTPase-TBC domain-containing protein [Gilbertella persicaria]|uniref:rab-GTPase-TBC domain-containing protein n=1 Tax=Gilbertella persicaria TaxID=101096 RepID=UPI00221FF3A3|nr:rab-GTPase-TBC domain-containing protein [Gilbertella persicaria]KAI8048042.1 rab-GTPase-TBC domain-containing protein [Gilbertella persicaria]